MPEIIKRMASSFLVTDCIILKNKKERNLSVCSEEKRKEVKNNSAVILASGLLLDCWSTCWRWGRSEFVDEYPIIDFGILDRSVDNPDEEIW